MVDPVGFNWDAWFQTGMPSWNEADTKVFEKQMDSSINAFQSQIKKLHEDNKKATDELTQDNS
jgi:hypothetical protein